MSPGEFYHSSWQHPLLLWLTQFLFFLAIYLGVRRVFGDKELRTPFARRLTFVFVILQLLSGVDAWLTANVVFGFSGGSLPVSFQSIIPLFFVLFGDFRIFWTMHWLSDPKSDLRSLWPEKSFRRALLPTLFVPVLTQLLLLFWETAFGPSSSRHMFLIYELLFLIWIRFFVGRSDGRGKYAHLALAVSTAVYVLWSSADILIFAGFESLGFTVRSLANVSYYSISLPLLWLCALTERIGCAMLVSKPKS